MGWSLAVAVTDVSFILAVGALFSTMDVQGGCPMQHNNRLLTNCLQACHFNSGLCTGWTSDSWETEKCLRNGNQEICDPTQESNGTFAYINSSNTDANLTTDLKQGSEEADTLYLTFMFLVTKSNVLSVIAELDEGQHVLWNSSETENWTRGETELDNSTTKIIFRGELKGEEWGVVAIDDVEIQIGGSDTEIPSSTLPPTNTTRAQSNEPAKVTTAVSSQSSSSSIGTTEATSAESRSPSSTNNRSSMVIYVARGPNSTTLSATETSTTTANTVVTHLSSSTGSVSTTVTSSASTSLVPPGTEVTLPTTADTFPSDSPAVLPVTDTAGQSSTVHTLPQSRTDSRDKDPPHGTSVPKKHADGGGSSAPVIAGIVVAVLVLVVVVTVIVIIVWRRRTRKRHAGNNKESIKPVMSFEQGHISSKAQDCQNNNNTGSTSSNLPTAPAAENDYAYIDEVTSSRPHSDVNPYEVAADGAPENVRTLSGNYSHIADLGTTKMASTKKKEGSKEGDYSQVDDNFYSVVKPVLNGVIVCHMPKRDGKTDGTTTRVPKRSESRATQPGHKPTVAPAPAQQEGDYNTITHDRNHSIAPVRGRGTTVHPYNLPESYNIAAPVVIRGDGRNPRPDTAFKPDQTKSDGRSAGQTDGDYNTISHGRNPQLSKKGMDTNANPYNVPESTTPVDIPDSGEDGSGPAPHSRFMLQPDQASDGQGTSKADGDYSTVARDRDKPTWSERREIGTTPSSVPSSPYSMAKPLLDEQTPHSAGDTNIASQSEGKYADDTGIYFILEPDPVSGDSAGNSEQTHRGRVGRSLTDYSTLSFAAAAAAHSQSGRDGRGERARSAYDRVRTDSDDAYSVATPGKRNVIIDSVYDQVKL